MKTNAETVQIFKWLNGANDVESSYAPIDRVDYTLDWSFKALHLFNNETRNENETPNGYQPFLVMAKGSGTASLTREMVNFVLNTLNLTEFLNRIHLNGYGKDELLFSTINAADALEAPGGFTRVCAENKVEVHFMSRYANWIPPYGPSCLSDLQRHTLCIFGIEYLPTRLLKMPHLFANKMMPEYDFGAIGCWYEELFRRSYLENESSQLNRLDPHFYQTMPQVTFQRFKEDGKKTNEQMDLNKFNCSWKYSQQAYFGTNLV